MNRNTLPRRVSRFTSNVLFCCGEVAVITLICILRFFRIKIRSRVTFDNILSEYILTMLRLTSALSIGCLMLTGIVTKAVNGPGVGISMIIAAFASGIATTCYAEFSCQIPISSSVSGYYGKALGAVGEGIIFMTGANLILELSIGTALIARGLCLYIDILLGNVLTASIKNILPANIINLKIDFLIPTYLDLLVFLIVILATLILLFDILNSNMLNLLANLITVTIICTIIAFGVSEVNFDFCKLLPYVTEKCKFEIIEIISQLNVHNLITGATKFYFAFIGFSSVSMMFGKMGSAREPRSRLFIIPIIVLFCTYLAIAVLLIMTDTFQFTNSVIPIATMFKHRQSNLIVTIETVVALIVTLFGGISPVCGGIDLLIEQSLFDVDVTKRRCINIWVTTISTLVTAFLAAALDISKLIDMLSVVTLLTYLLVAICLIAMRYKPTQEEEEASHNAPPIQETTNARNITVIAKTIFNTYNIQRPTKQTLPIIYTHLSSFYILSVTLCNFIISASEKSHNFTYIGFVISPMLLMVVILHRQPQSSRYLPFKVSGFPWIPCTGILMNIYLIMQHGGYIYVLSWLSLCFALFFASNVFLRNNDVQRDSPIYADIAVSDNDTVTVTVDAAAEDTTQETNV